MCEPAAGLAAGKFHGAKRVQENLVLRQGVSLQLVSIQRGDLEAFNLLIPSYQNLLLHIALELLKDADAAEDAVQDAFISRTGLVVINGVGAAFPSDTITVGAQITLHDLFGTPPF